jgi:hypothetical protein
MISGDYAVPPTAVLKQGLRRRRVSSRSARAGHPLIALNNTVKPFDNSTSARRSPPVNKNDLRTTPRRADVGRSPRTSSRRDAGFEEAGGKGRGARLSQEPERRL